MPDKLINRISTPHQLRRLSVGELTQLAEELRETIIAVVSRQGGHLASNLGIAELTVALHYVFDFTHDRLLWDVGHQCYAHKILTGRGDRFETLRTAGGLSGFPSPTESEYDLFATGHAGTAISTATGMAWADLHSQHDTHVVAVVGDASIVNGLSFEGINNVALLPRQFLIILNDNSMAIDRTQGALAGALDRIRMTSAYCDLKTSAEHLLQHLPLGENISEAIKHIRDGLRTTLHGVQPFESLGMTYFGPVDGHNMQELIDVLRRLGTINRPVLLHVHTQKGRGCEYAVEDPCRFHSPSAYKNEGGRIIFPPAKRPTWTDVFSDALASAAAKDDRIVAITAAMPDGTGLVKFREQFPDRYLDVGICESHAVAMAAGMAKAGLKPIVAVYSTFMQRAVDQVFEELALQKLPVVICMDRAGLVGSDGAVHHGFADIAYFRPLPGLTLMAPACADELPAALDLALTLEGPSAIRYPRDEVPPDAPPCKPFELGKAVTVREGQQGAMVCYGTTLEQALAAARILHSEDKIDCAVVNARFAKPLDVPLLSRLIASGKPMLLVEDHATTGGFGSAVLEMAASRGLDTSNIRLVGIPDRFIAHGKRQEQLAEVGLDATSLAAMMKELVRHGTRIGKYI